LLNILKLESRRKNIIYILAAIIIIVILLFVFFRTELKKKYEYFKAVASLSDSEAILVLDFDGRKQEEQRWFKGSIVEGMTLANVLQAASVAGNFKISIDSNINEIDNVANNGESRWTCYLNNRKVQDNLTDAKINSKDRMACRYQ